MTLKEEIQILLLKKGMSMSELVRRLNDKYGRNNSAQNLHKKFSRETLKYNEVLEIAEILGYEIHWKPKEENND